MDEIQKVLVKAGRKDLAQKYYEKTTAKEVSGVEYDKAKMSKVVDNFVRFLIGNPNGAMRALKTLGNPDVLIGDDIINSGKYTEMFNKLNSEFMAVVKRNLK